MEKIINTFKSMLENNPDCPVTFPLDTDDSQSMRFIEYLNDNRTLVEHNGKIVFIPFGKNIERFVCGVAPIWKEYKDRKSFEYYYTNSEMMRELFCNEKDDDDKLIPMFTEIGGIKYIVTWESTKKNDIFHYKQATLHERGLFDVLWSNFGGGIKDDKKILNPRFGIMFDRAINKDYGLSVGMVKSILDRCDNLDYNACGEVKLDIG